MGFGNVGEVKIKHENTHLLSIGINDYESVAKLGGAVNDAVKFKELLIDKFDLIEENCTLLIDKEATKENILKTIINLTNRLTNEENLIILFSGHSRYDTHSREGYWVPVEGVEKNLKTYISNLELLTILNEAKLRHLLLIIDTVHSGSIFDKNWFDIRNSSALDTSTNTNSSRWALTACTKDELAYELRGSGVFSSGIQKVLMETDNDITLSDLYHKIANLKISDLGSKTKRDRKLWQKLPQTPMLSPLYINGHSKGEYTFSLNPTKNLTLLDNEKEMLPVFIEEYGENHPKIAIRKSKLARELILINNYDEAHKHLDNALKIDLDNFGEKHPIIVTDKNNLAVVLQLQGKVDQASKLFEEAFFLGKEVFKEDEELIKTIQNNIQKINKHSNPSKWGINSTRKIII